jgi:hypothetical protein
VVRAAEAALHLGGNPAPLSRATTNPVTRRVHPFQPSDDPAVEVRQCPGPRDRSLCALVNVTLDPMAAP